MSKKRAASSSSKALSRLFGPPPLLEGEDAAAYDELLARVSSAVNPSDLIEEIWVRDIVDLTIEILRWRRLRTALLEAAVSDARDRAVNPVINGELDRLAQEQWELEQQELDNKEQGLIELLQEPEPEPEPELSWDDWKNRFKENPAVVKKLRKVRALVESKLDMEILTARVFVGQLKHIERIDQLTTIAEGRRNVILREIDRRRAAFAQALRDKVQKVEDAEFETIEPKAIVSTGTAKSAA